MSININGCTMCNTPGQEVYESYRTKVKGKAVTRVQYDYRHTNGVLFTCIGTSLDNCREQRDLWLKTQ